MRDTITLYDKKIKYEGNYYQIKDFCLLKDKIYIKLFRTLDKMYLNVPIENIISLIK
mgnify:CR=1 FL=1